MRKYLGHFLMIAVALGGGIAVGQDAGSKVAAPTAVDTKAASQAPVPQLAPAAAGNAAAGSSATPAADPVIAAPAPNLADVEAEDAATASDANGEQGSMPDSGTQAEGTKDNQWRYRMFHGRWWYWLPSKTWVVWNGSSWVPPDQLVTSRERTYIGNSGYYDGPYYTGYGYRSGYRPGPNYYYGPGSYYNYSPNGYYNFGPYTSGGYYNGTWGTGYRGYNYGPGFGGFNYGGLGSGMGSNFGGGFGVGIGAGVGSW